MQNLGHIHVNAMDHQCVRQVEPDGVGRELATEYQLFILEFLLMAGGLGHITGDPFPQPFVAGLDRTDHDGLLPRSRRHEVDAVRPALAVRPLISKTLFRRY